ncbi:hypothetical protein DFP72DRAFT_1067340 [Ephemerocybe angulata]|uniref:Uncharacterized protein n=1 Tax=Ephemerocybe angulata TaxID=980116 RepID=A0A8H6I167_9AGAR|nr:hypothetical protein DFP72DRAFT_1067340 [Tulosesus angulatus]
MFKRGSPIDRDRTYRQCITETVTNIQYRNVSTSFSGGPAQHRYEYKLEALVQSYSQKYFTFPSNIQVTIYTMRLSLPTLLTVAISLVHIVNAQQDYTLDAREYVDELVARKEAYNALERRHLFADISTRELIAELSDRLERRAEWWTCRFCRTIFNTKEEADRSACTGKGSGGEHRLQHHVSGRN